MVTLIRYRLIGLFCVSAALLAGGCEGSLIPNNDPALRQTQRSFSADAARRHYEADAPKAPATDFRADYALSYRRVELANISASDRANVEVWINRKFVAFCQKFENKSGKSIPFHDFFDSQGHHFDTDGGTNPIQSIEVYCDGTMYTVNNHVEDLR